MSLLAETCERAQQHGVILDGGETRHRTDHKGIRRDTPAAKSRTADLSAHRSECALLNEVWQLDDPRGGNPFVINQKAGGQCAVGENAMRETVAPAIENRQPRARYIIEPAATGDDPIPAQPCPEGRKDVGIHVVGVDELDSITPQKAQE